MVGAVPAGLERGRHDQHTISTTTILHPHVRHIRDVGMWGLLGDALVLLSMGWRLGRNAHYGQGAPPNCYDRGAMGAQWSGRRILAGCDNTATVAIINSGTSRHPVVMHLVRALAFLAAHFNFTISSRHLLRVQNGAADALSRDNIEFFHSLLPQANRNPTKI